MNPLMPCPCCGSVARLMPMAGHSKAKAMCRNIDCYLQTPLLSEKEAEAVWNNRPDVQA